MIILLTSLKMIPSCVFIFLFSTQVIVCDELNVGDAIDTMEAVDSLKNVIVIGKPEMEVKDCIAIGDLLEDDGKSAPKTQKPDADWEKQTIFLPFSSTAGSSKTLFCF